MIQLPLEAKVTLVIVAPFFAAAAVIASPALVYLWARKTIRRHRQRV